LNDLQEVLAGTSRGTGLDDLDTDRDGVKDGVDNEPLHSFSQDFHRLLSGRRITPGGGWFVRDSTFYYASLMHASWSDSTMNFDFDIPDTAGVLIQIDANNDGWFHGFDNLQIRLKATADSVAVVDCYLRDCSSWTNPPKDRKEILPSTWLGVHRDARRDSYSIVSLSIPRLNSYGLDFYSGKKFALRLGVQTTADRWVWNELFERNYMMTVELK
jgi:hypothetical protein